MFNPFKSQDESQKLVCKWEDKLADVHVENLQRVLESTPMGTKEWKERFLSLDSAYSNERQRINKRLPKWMQDELKEQDK